MSDHGSKASESFAKSAGKPAKDFDVNQEFAEYLPKVSEKTRERIKMIAELGSQRLQKEANDQKRHHTFRVMREENKLLKDYISNPRPHPQNHDASKDIKSISEQAERNVIQKEAQYLENTKYDVRLSIQTVITEDFKTQQQAHLSQSHSAPERER